jgi:hypothetical protein
MFNFAEADLSRNFRKKEAEFLAKQLENHHSVVVTGMKRVGISVFVKFFITHYQQSDQFFVYVDLNNLVELTPTAFWILVLTRLVDNLQKINLPELAKADGRHRFIQSIQLKDVFFIQESIRNILAKIKTAGLKPVFFINHYDRWRQKVLPEFFHDLFGQFVLTGCQLPSEFKGHAIELRLNLANRIDSLILLNYWLRRHRLTVSQPLKAWLVNLCAGHAQYLQLAVVVLAQAKSLPLSQTDLLKLLVADEQINFFSEELFVSGVHQPFNPLFSAYLKNRRTAKTQTELTDKETRLFDLFKRRRGQICSRDQIIDAVWPETKESGITDWAIERLIFRIRQKLPHYHKKYKIITIHTRGYKLI